MTPLNSQLYRAMADYDRAIFWSHGVTIQRDAFRK